MDVALLLEVAVPAGDTAAAAEEADASSERSPAARP
jgi:hypothetical protein